MTDLPVGALQAMAARIATWLAGLAPDDAEAELQALADSCIEDAATRGIPHDRAAAAATMVTALVRARLREVAARGGAAAGRA